MRDVDHTDLQTIGEIRSEQERAANLKRANELEDFRWLMSDKRGRRFVWRLLSLARVFSLTFRESSKEQDFLEGMRNVGVMLVADAHESCLNLYHQMEKEHALNARRKPTQ